MGLLEKIYDNSPVFIQNIMCSAKGWFIVRRRYNKDFHLFLDRYLKREVNQDELLMSFLINVKHIKPYSSFITYGLDKGLSAKEIINSMPIIDKTFVKNNIEEFKNKFYHEKMIEMRTSGTTGSGLIFPYSVDMENKQWAIWWRYRIELGITIDTWCGWFGGKRIISGVKNNSLYWRINHPGKQIMFSTFHMNESTIEKYHNEINRKRLKWLHGYPSHLAKFANLAILKGLSTIRCVNIVTTGAENLYSYQIEAIKRIFPNCIVRQHYGQNEGVANISQDKDGNWHVDDDFCYTEFIPVSENNPEICRIIGTGFSNLAFPLIRYDTGDLARVKYNENGTLDILSIDGRSSNVIKQKSGGDICEASLSIFLHDYMEIAEAQFHQKTLYEVDLIIVRGLGYTNDTEKKIIESAKKFFDRSLKLNIKYTDRIERTIAGKLRLVISDIN